VEHLRCSCCGLMQAWPLNNDTYACKRCCSSSADIDILRSMGSLHDGAFHGSHRPISSNMGLSDPSTTIVGQSLPQSRVSFEQQIAGAANHEPWSTPPLHHDNVTLERQSSTLFVLVANQKSAGQSQWVCSSCTYSNATCQQHCDVCGEAKDDNEEEEADCHICMVNKANVVLFAVCSWWSLQAMLGENNWA